MVRRIAERLSRSCDSIRGKARLLGLNIKDRVQPQRKQAPAFVVIGDVDNAESRDNRNQESIYHVIIADESFEETTDRSEMIPV